MAATGNCGFRAVKKNSFLVIYHVTITNNNSVLLVESVTLVRTSKMSAIKQRARPQIRAAALVFVIKNVGFHCLMDHLEPRYSLPGRKHVSETALPKL